MPHKKIIYALLLIIAFLFLLLGASYFLAKKQAPLPPTGKTTDKTAADAVPPSVLTAVILGTDKNVYAADEDITALILVKNEFDSAKDWKIIAGIKEKNAEPDSSYILQQEKSIRLSPDETTREELVFSPQGSGLTPKEYRLELSILENNQEISLKTVIFEVR